VAPLNGGRAAVATATAVTAVTAVIMFAERRATRRRLVTVTDEAIHLRYGIVVPLSRVRLAEPCRGRPGRIQGRLRLAGMGQANVRIELSPGTRLATALGERDVSEIFVGVDEPERFMRAVAAGRSAAS
jgi:hypothetical protein